ncbi:unnamed protein product [Cuscuta campestris]|uniref:Uncharacterized protein n=1 Tax=Cuscuta campestris TaxID=132261 RepID=A0A484M053_9ASTE|nr:unnamed protein product [Cuscuta campestris]VFQ81897.1 unnamed protein product [Cuscuta campestris]
MKTGAKLIVLHPSLHKQGIPAVPSSSHRILALVFAAFFGFGFALSLFSGKHAVPGALTLAAAEAARPQLPQPAIDALLYYATLNTSSVGSRMSSPEVSAVVASLRRCGYACNFLVFGLTHETLLWNSLNHNGRTVIVDESAYAVSKLEEKNPGIEAYDVQFTTRVSEFRNLLKHADEEAKRDCRPVQNLLFSDCKLAINDLPNHLYDVAWDVILVDGPRGYSQSAPGRMSAIFTAGVLARSKRGGAAQTQVFVHEIDRVVERVSSERFLCRGNLVNSVGKLGHYAVGKFEAKENRFCS